MALMYSASGQLARRHPILRAYRNPQRWRSSRSGFLNLSEEVEDAIASKKPVVALESTIYTHGFPKPDNVSLAFHLESTVRQHGGIPATIGVLDGVAHVGMSPEGLAKLTSSAGESSTLKLSRRDLGFATGMQLAGKYFTGGTTVAGTMVLAHLAGIRIFATGGLGGVHRGAESSMDISADLTELGRTPVAVFSSGCKSFLDIPRTLEYLETQGVGVATFADSRGEKVDFPSFWSRESGVSSPMTVQDESQAASMIHAQNSLGLSSGLLFGNPIPQAYEIPKADIEEVINDAIKEAQTTGAVGKDNTPYILSKIWELTRGRSLEANRALIESNAVRATNVAIRLAELEVDDSETRPTMIGPAASNYAFNGASISIAHHSAIPNKKGASPAKVAPNPLPSQPQRSFPSADVVVAGAVAMDYTCDYLPPQGSSSLIHPQPQTSNPARIFQSVGGVARNIAVACQYLRSRVLFCCARGNDVAGDAVAADVTSHGLPLHGVKRISEMLEKANTAVSEQSQTSSEGPATVNTAQYVAVNDANKDLSVAMADMSILEKIGPDVITKWWIEPIQKYIKPKWLVLDTNWASEGIATWLDAAKSVGAKVAVDPVSVAKSLRIFSRGSNGIQQIGIFPHHKIHLLAPNKLELAAMHEAARSNGIFETTQWWGVIDSLGIPASGARIAYESIAGKAVVDEGIPQMSTQLLPLCQCLVVKLGDKGVLMTELLHSEDERLRSPEEAQWIVSRSTRGGEVGGIYMRFFPATKIPQDQIKSVNGVGDTFLGTLIAGLVNKDAKVQDLVDVAQKASRLTLQSTKSVSERLIELKHAL